MGSGVPKTRGYPNHCDSVSHYESQEEKKNDTAFMDIIKEFPVLYNRACADFKDRNIKNNAWRKISELLDIEESKCVKRYESISISSCASMLLKCCYICVQFSILAHFPFPAKFEIGKIWDRPLANIRYIGKIWDGRQQVKSPIVWDFPDI